MDNVETIPYSLGIPFRSTPMSDDRGLHKRTRMKFQQYMCPLVICCSNRINLAIKVEIEPI